MGLPSKLILFWVLIGYIPVGYSQDIGSMSGELDIVFIIGENEVQYEQLVSDTKGNLYEVCDHSMEDAYKAWQGMLIEMAQFAKDQNLDINGVKIWMNTFWNSDGTIKNIVYYPKLNSKNIDFSKLTVLLKDFSLQYQLTYSSEIDFAHYGQATFPVYPIRATDN